MYESRHWTQKYQVKWILSFTNRNWIFAQSVFFGQHLHILKWTKGEGEMVEGWMLTIIDKNTVCHLLMTPVLPMNCFYVFQITCKKNVVKSGTFVSDF